MKRCDFWLVLMDGVDDTWATFGMTACNDGDMFDCATGCAIRLLLNWFFRNAFGSCDDEDGSTGGGGCWINDGVDRLLLD